MPDGRDVGGRGTSRKGAGVVAGPDGVTISSLSCLNAAFWLSARKAGSPRSNSRCSLIAAGPAFDWVCTPCGRRLPLSLAAR